MSEQYYKPSKRFKVTFYIKNTNQSISSELNNVQHLIEKQILKRFKKWIVLPSSDKTPDIFIKRSSISFYSVEAVKKDGTKA